MNVGVVSDTHGLVRASLLEALDGVDHILHAGDVGPPDVLVEFEALAPVTAVRGNTDAFEIRERLPSVARLELAGRRTVLLHGDELPAATPEHAVEVHPEADLVVLGHTHRPLIRWLGDTLVVNPGSAGPRRFGLPPSFALLRIGEGEMRARTIHLPD